MASLIYKNLYTFSENAICEEGQKELNEFEIYSVVGVFHTGRFLDLLYKVRTTQEFKKCAIEFGVIVEHATITTTLKDILFPTYKVDFTMTVINETIQPWYHPDLSEDCNQQEFDLECDNRPFVIQDPYPSNEFGIYVPNQKRADDYARMMLRWAFKNGLKISFKDKAPTLPSITRTYTHDDNKDIPLSFSLDFSGEPAKNDESKFYYRAYSYRTGTGEKFFCQQVIEFNVIKYKEIAYDRKDYVDQYLDSVLVEENNCGDYFEEKNYVKTWNQNYEVEIGYEKYHEGAFCHKIAILTGSNLQRDNFTGIDPQISYIKDSDVKVTNTRKFVENEDLNEVFASENDLMTTISDYHIAISREYVEEYPSERELSKEMTMMKVRASAFESITPYNVQTYQFFGPNIYFRNMEPTEPVDEETYKSAGVLLIQTFFKNLNINRRIIKWDKEVLRISHYLASRYKIRRMEENVSFEKKTAHTRWGLAEYILSRLSPNFLPRHRSNVDQSEYDYFYAILLLHDNYQMIQELYQITRHIPLPTLLHKRLPTYFCSLYMELGEIEKGKDNVPNSERIIKTFIERIKGRIKFPPRASLHLEDVRHLDKILESGGRTEFSGCDSEGYFDRECVPVKFHYSPLTMAMFKDERMKWYFEALERGRKELEKTTSAKKFKQKRYDSVYDALKLSLDKIPHRENDQRKRKESSRDNPNNNNSDTG